MTRVASPVRLVNYFITLPALSLLSFFLNIEPSDERKDLSVGPSWFPCFSVIGVNALILVMRLFSLS